MMRTRWKKVFHDLWDNKSRSFLVIASIFIGVYNVGLSIALYDVVGTDLTTTWERINPNQAEIYTAGFDPDFLPSVGKVDGVAQAQGQRMVSVKMKTSSGEWIPLQLYTRPQFDPHGLDQILPYSGAWPPADRQLVIEYHSLRFADVQVGEEVEIELNDGTIRRVPVVGIVRDMRVQASALGINGYVSYDTLEWLHETPYLDRIVITVSEDHLDKAHIQAVADRVADHARKSGVYVALTFVANPGEHPGAESVLGVVAVIGALGSFSILLACFLIFNILSALLNQHIKQIGIMKAIGARRGQIGGMYVVLVLVFSLLALAPAIPLAALSASAVTVTMAEQFNYLSLGFRWVPAALIVQIVIGLLAPLLAAMLPVFTGTRITVYQALSTYGLGQGHFKRSLIDRLVELARFLSRPALISLRNTFRRKGRLFLTLTTLVLGGAIFIAVINLRQSMISFVDQFSKYFQSDVNLSLEQWYPIDGVKPLLENIPGVAYVEAWSAAGGELLRADGTAEEAVQIIAPPVDSALIEPEVMRGRWVIPGDENAIVLNNAFWRARPDLQVGDQIAILINGRRTVWTVVGFFQFPGDLQLIGYTSAEYLSRLINEPNRSPIYRISGADHSPAAQQALVDQVEQVLIAKGIKYSEVQPGSLLIEANAQVINIIIGFFLFSALMVAAVGAIGLTGTMSMNVMERTREIGVMRAIGASTRAVLRIVMLEGALIGLISWGFASLAAIPISHLLYGLLSVSLFQSAGKAVITNDGPLIWLGAAIGLSVIASLLPAHSAARMTVREVLAYE